MVREERIDDSEADAIEAALKQAEQRKSRRTDQGHEPPWEGGGQDGRNEMGMTAMRATSCSHETVIRCSLQLTSNGKIALCLGGFCPPALAQALRANGKFQREAKACGNWRIDPAEFEQGLSEVKQAAQAKGVNLEVQPLPPIPAKALERGFGKDERWRVANIGFMDKLFPFQREGVEFILRRNGRGLIADEMGCGKTVQALAIAEAFRDEWPVVILVPPVMRDVWREAALQWVSHLKEGDIAVMSKGSERVDGRQFIIVPYSRVQQAASQLPWVNFRMVVADESHYLKDGSTKRSKAAKVLIQRARRAIMLSGTPALSRPWELFSQVSMLRPDVFHSYRQYTARYCGNSPFPNKGCSNTEELHGLLSWMLMIRRLKRDVLDQLPDKIREQVYLTVEDVDKAGMKKLKQIMDAVEEKSAKLERCTEPEQQSSLKLEHDTLLTKLYVETADVKREPVQNHIKLLLESGCRFLFFAHHRQMLDAAEEAMRSSNCSYIRIDGSTTPSSRTEQAKSFESNTSSIRAAILSITAAGTGLSFTSTSHVVFGEMSWTPADLQQAEDRVHRIGQDNPVTVQYLHLRQSVDDVLWNTICSKLGNMGQVLNGRNEHLNVASREAPRRPAVGSSGPASAQGKRTNALERFLHNGSEKDGNRERTNSCSAAGASTASACSGQRGEAGRAEHGAPAKAEENVYDLTEPLQEQHRAKELDANDGEWPTIDGWGPEWEGDNAQPVDLREHIGPIILD